MAFLTASYFPPPLALPDELQGAGNEIPLHWLVPLNSQFTLLLSPLNCLWHQMTGPTLPKATTCQGVWREMPKRPTGRSRHQVQSDELDTTRHRGCKARLIQRRTPMQPEQENEPLSMHAHFQSFGWLDPPTTLSASLFLFLPYLIWAAEEKLEKNEEASLLSWEMYLKENYLQHQQCQKKQNTEQTIQEIANRWGLPFLA